MSDMGMAEDADRLRRESASALVSSEDIRRQWQAQAWESTNSAVKEFVPLAQSGGLNAKGVVTRRWKIDIEPSIGHDDSCSTLEIKTSGDGWELKYHNPNTNDHSVRASSKRPGVFKLGPDTLDRIRPALVKALSG